MQKIGNVDVVGRNGDRNLSFTFGDKAMKLTLTGDWPADQEFINEISGLFEKLASSQGLVNIQQFGKSTKAESGFDIFSAQARGCICSLKGDYPQQAIYDFAPKLRYAVDMLNERQRADKTPGL